MLRAGRRSWQTAGCSRSSWRRGDSVRPVSGVLAGVRVGHWSDTAARTGCTVLLFPGGTVASGEVRGGAPGTREWALLAPERTVARVDAVLLTGGSAFGLAAADGVSRWCEERGMGFPTSAGPVPIVVGAVLYDLDVGDSRRRPGPAEGYAACVAAEAWPGPNGVLGAGTGSTMGRWRGASERLPGGLATSSRQVGALVVGALMVVNAVGDLLASDRQGVATSEELSRFDPAASGRTATTIGVVVTNARLDKLACLLVANSAHDGLARALEPAHTGGDGDAVVTAATGHVDAPVGLVRVLATAVVEEAIRIAAAGAGESDARAGESEPLAGR